MASILFVLFLIFLSRPPPTTYLPPPELCRVGTEIGRQSGGRQGNLNAKKWAAQLFFSLGCSLKASFGAGEGQAGNHGSAIARKAFLVGRKLTLGKPFLCSFFSLSLTLSVCVYVEGRDLRGQLIYITSWASCRCRLACLPVCWLETIMQERCHVLCMETNICLRLTCMYRPNYQCV
ncbi:hypothetical protein B0T24DRAFT_603146 [Lasiosphaeria ovina]|uniref:Secreted protein n=1 Tax=Lasiosphaeria ovina TaxID=92902 RepID=A0AAE0TXB5_9PEZI|nr:hypothetical protein B0T24DRAFT_603146 [Lasiosphaeria ovina]